MKITGCLTALITPFSADREIDYPAFARNIDRQLRASIDGIVVLGTTGEAPTISNSELSGLFEFAVEQIDGKALCILGTSSNNTRTAIWENELAAAAGADAVLSCAPYYNKPTQKGIYEHFSAIASASELPVVLYNVPGRTVVTIENQTILDLCQEFENIVAVKEASGDLQKVEELIKMLPPEISVLSGNDDQNVDVIHLGGQGAISVASNALPKLIREVTQMALSGNVLQARELEKPLKNFLQDIFLENNPQAIKTLCSEIGLCTETFRLPLTTMQPENKAKLLQSWATLGDLQEQ